MEILEQKDRFTVNLTEEAIQLDILVLKLTPGIIPDTYGHITNDILQSHNDLETISFSGNMYHEIMEKHYALFQEEKGFSSNVLFFLRACPVNNDHRWTQVTSWDRHDSEYITSSLSESPNGNYFIEPWRNAADRKRLLENSIFLIVGSKKSLPTLCSDCKEELTTGEVMSKIMSIGKDDRSINSQPGKAYCEKCIAKSYKDGTFVGNY